MNSESRRVGVRVNLTLPREIVETLDRIEAVTGVGRASMIREWLIEGHAGLQEMAKALELAAAKNLDAFKVLAKSIDKASSDADQLSLDIKRTHRRIRRKRKSEE